MKKLIMSIMACAMIFSAAKVSAQSMEEAAAKFEAAAEMINAKKFVESIPLLEQAMALSIDAGDAGLEMTKDIQGLLPKMHLQKGGALVKEKKFDDAIAALLKAEELADLYGDTSTKSNAARLISNVYMFQGIDSFNNKDYKTALVVFEKGYKQDPKNIKLALYTAQSYAALEQFQQCSDIFKTVIDAGAKNSKFAEDAKTAQTELETSILAAASKKAADKDLDGVIELSDMVINVIPTSAKAHILPIQVANNLKKYDVVIARGDAAATAQTDAAVKSDVYLMLGVAYQNKDNKAKATEALKKVTAGAGVAEAKALIAQLSQ